MTKPMRKEVTVCKVYHRQKLCSVKIYIYIYIYRQEAWWLNKLRYIIKLTKLSTVYARSRGIMRPSVECHHMPSWNIINAKITPVFAPHISDSRFQIPDLDLWASWKHYGAPRKMTQASAHLGPKGINMTFESWKLSWKNSNESSGNFFLHTKRKPEISPYLG